MFCDIMIWLKAIQIAQIKINKKFEKKISSYTGDDLREFAAYFSLDISSKDEYYNVKIISEISYNLALKEKFTKNDRFIILALKYWGRCVYLSSEKGLWKDIIKYGKLIYVIDPQ